MSLKANITANYGGQGWRALMSLAFVPLYIKYLGIEAYGIITLFALVQASLGLLDMGLRPVLSREMGHFVGGARSVQAIATLLRSVELVALTMAVLFAVGLSLASGWIAGDWVKAEHLSKTTAAQAIALMGVVAALQFCESLYTSALSGLQRQVLENAIGSISVTLRSAGAVGIIVFVSPTLEAFFLWQAAVSVLSLALFALATYRVLPKPPRRARFSWAALKEVRAYAGGMLGITLLAFLRTQVDKVLLSSQLPLDAFAHYMLATLVANSMGTLSTPIGAAFYPKFNELVAQGNLARLRHVFHVAAQATTVVLASAGAMLIFFGDRLLYVWTQNAPLAAEVAPLLSVIVLGLVLNSTTGVPLLIQLAFGWTKLAFRLNVITLIVQVPLLLFMIANYGSFGAALATAVLSGAYLVVSSIWMFRRLLRDSGASWGVYDVGLPLGAALCAGAASWAVVPKTYEILPTLAYLAGAGLVISLTTISVSPLIRNLVKDRLLRAKAHPVSTKEGAA